MLCFLNCVCVGGGKHLRGQPFLCNVMKNVCLPVGHSRGLPAATEPANEGVFARVCACVSAYTLKPSKCSLQRGDPST